MYPAYKIIVLSIMDNQKLLIQPNHKLADLKWNTFWRRR